MYTGCNFETKEDLIRAVRSGRRVSVYQPREVRFFTKKSLPSEGIVSLEGPHLIPYKPGMKAYHDWFTSARIKNGIIVEVPSFHIEEIGIKIGKLKEKPLTRKRVEGRKKYVGI